MNKLKLKKTNLYHLNNNNINKNIDAIIDYHFGKDTSKKIQEKEKKDYFFQSLNFLQRSQIPSEPQGIKIIFENEVLSKHLIDSKIFEEEDTINSKHIIPTNERSRILNNIEKALCLLKLLHPGLQQQINKLVGTIYIAKKRGYGGGTVSNLLGMIWISPQEKWSIIDYAENLYHEFIHNSLFLDDMVNCIFPDPQACANEEALTISTILKSRRPLDKSYHAANVAIGIMHFYYLLSDNKKSKMYKEDLEKTIIEINQRTQYLGERGIETLKEMNNFIEFYDFESISSSLNNE
ncbi:HEXXH motif-containing putative peptide modification protein [Priestia aryabhattai]|uniref:aKG-HExxH-type peptide beta-hydroxylase n=1 Tax=Priestia aryabhattai TaxID=412384 RepID=UPI002E238B27|nr:HEXXH motif-containing putative peptide modification protein [Priestia aryabhattai]